ncbi:Cytohesin-2 [Fasciola hepatica]|uniref:Cytohesin-2 n=1 Tax=Fasciola hepatica TaxID=6192 RepID=A0A4E0RBH9_FASHE|nr:Cytohesin-2 [Fasciola hepatica]
MECEELTAEEKERLKYITQQKLQVMKHIESLKIELHDITNQIENLGFPLDCEDPQMRRRIIGCKEFNADTKQGLDYLFENKVVERTPEAVARFFIEEKDRLSKFAVGTFLGEVRKEFNMQVLDAFTNLHNFRDQDFLQALRRFLLSFQLPGESQKIDRILTSFAERYVSHNPAIFKSPHEAYVLAYAVILLNTTLHNANAKGQNFGLADEKTFVRTMLDYDDQTELSEDLVRRVYHEIKAEPIRPASDDGLNGSNQSNAIMRGWLMKLGGRVKSWKRRWFVLTEDSLIYYLTPDRSRHCKGVIPLEGLNIRITQDRTKDHTFELYSSRNELIKASKADREGTTTPVPHREPGHHTVYRLAAPSSAERDNWIRMLESITHRIAEHRAVRSISVDCSGSSAMTNGVRTPRRLPSPVASTSLKRNAGAGSHPDLPSQHSVLN